MNYNAETLKNIMEETGLSRKQIRDIMNVPRTTFNSWFYTTNTHREMSWTEVERCALLLYVKGIKSPMVTRIVNRSKGRIE